MSHSVSVWESAPETYHYNPVGYMQISPGVMHEGVASIYEQQKEIGYESTFIESSDDCMTYMRGLFDDWTLFWPKFRSGRQSAAPLLPKP